jgi:hypothetical protein
MKASKKLLVYHVSFYVYGSIVAALGLREVFSGNFGAVPVFLTVAGVGVALAPGYELQKKGSPREYLPSDRVTVLMGAFAVAGAASGLMTIA